MDLENTSACLALADGRLFAGQAYGAPGTVTGEIVFNTSLTGYQEILTDPSYCGQIVVMTPPHIGNVGVNPEDIEADRPWITALVVREASRRVSSWRATQSLADYLARYGVPGLTQVDTRALVRHIRHQGAMMAALSSDPTLSPDDLARLARAAPPIEGRDLVQEVTCREPFVWEEGVNPRWKVDDGMVPPTGPADGPQVGTDLAARSSPGNSACHVVAYDFGVKHNILRWLVEVGCRVTVVPATTPAAEALALGPDGIFLSNGPGDPAAVSYAIETTRQLIERSCPIFGICLGHQILALALGGRTHKLKFGHRGGNQPVREEATGRVTITVHNHGFAVTPGSLPEDVEVTHLNLNDGCVEGLRHKTRPVFSVQYHPEASPGPHDALSLFADFVQLMQPHRQ
jgi:carbamoyl-phosphate synthase small subunit